MARSEVPKGTGSRPGAGMIGRSDPGRTVPTPVHRAPHPIPYQGSKRRLAEAILAVVRGRRFDALYEPFAGSAALTLAAAGRGVADQFVIGDSLSPLAYLWERIIQSPEEAAADYERIWNGQLGPEGAPAHFNRVRAEFNADSDPIKLLYLLARCVKNAPRFDKKGSFNQSPDHRRTGMKPQKMRREMCGASQLLATKGTPFSGDAEGCVAAAGSKDLVYMDPPWQGTTEGTDTRYHQGFPRARLEALLDDLNARGVPWILSYDGRSGSRTYGELLPPELWGERMELHAGRSSQSTLVGRAEETVESLYISTRLVGNERSNRTVEQRPLFGVQQPAHVVA